MSQSNDIHMYIHTYIHTYIHIYIQYIYNLPDEAPTNDSNCKNVVVVVQNQQNPLPQQFTLDQD